MSDDAHFSKPQRICAPGRAQDLVSLGPLSELETALTGEPEQVRAALLLAGERIDALAQRARQAIGRGVPSAEFAQLSAILKACESAREILDAAAPTGRHSARMHLS
ncbi:hypothetical protein [Ottowia thiooxydans]|uniref:hypothetical protein n=1 Tax=Ottowia thiooxydans TaxID=219182 RepID=UPI0012EBCAB3|nr:hypothetical protein [Ottowia thiooxydans]